MPPHSDDVSIKSRLMQIRMKLNRSHKENLNEIVKEKHESTLKGQEGRIIATRRWLIENRIPYQTNNQSKKTKQDESDSDKEQDDSDHHNDSSSDNHHNDSSSNNQTDKQNQMSTIQQLMNIKKVISTSEKRKRKREMDESMDITIEDAERINSQKRKKQKSIEKIPQGWETLNMEAKFNSYKKRASKIPYSLTEYENAQKKHIELVEKTGDVSAIDEYGNVGVGENLIGTSELDSEEYKERMAKELFKEELRKKKAKRQRHSEFEDIDYINEENRAYSKQLEKQYGKYSKEWKRNLERGTSM